MEHKMEALQADKARLEEENAKLRKRVQPAGFRIRGGSTFTARGYTKRRNVERAMSAIMAVHPAIKTWKIGPNAAGEEDG